MGRPGKLSTTQVLQSADMYRRGLSVGVIAAYFGVTRQAMWSRLAPQVQMRPQLRYGPDNHFYRGGSRHDDRAHNLVEYAVRIGLIARRAECEQCGATGCLADGRALVQAHHDDYNKPLDVRWLCQRCHHAWHSINEAVPLTPGVRLPEARQC